MVKDSLTLEISLICPCLSLVDGVNFTDSASLWVFLLVLLFVKSRKQWERKILFILFDDKNSLMKDGEIRVRAWGRRVGSSEYFCTSSVKQRSPDTKDGNFFSPIRANCSESGRRESFEVGNRPPQPLLTSDPLVLGLNNYTPPSW